MWLCVGGARRSNRRTGVVSIASRRSATPFRRRRAHTPSPRARSGAPRGKRRHPEAGGCARDLTGPASLLPDAADVVFAGHVLVWAPQGTPCPSRVGVFPRVVAPTPRP